MLGLGDERARNKALPGELIKMLHQKNIIEV